MPRFLLVLRDGEWNPEAMSPEEIQSVLSRYRTWVDRVKGDGQKLRDNEGRVLRRNGSGKISVTDGPYAEAREVLGGFLVVEAPDYDAAVKLCEDSPHYQFGTIEIRQIEDPGA
ncbi:MAG: YciI family protein [Thermoanaerobaculia bacterium]